MKKRYAIYFLTNAREAPHIRIYDSEEQRDKAFTEVTQTKQIEHGRQIMNVLQARKCEVDGESFTNYELAKEQRLAEKVIS